MKRLIMIVVVMVTCIAFAGCGGSSGYGEGEQFQLGEDTYALEKVVRVADEDTDSTECYGVSILQVGNSSPVIISGIANGTLNTTSAINLTPEEETTEATTTTVAPTVGVDPNYDPEANKGIGDTDIYEPIESFDVNLPDTDF